MSQMTAQALGTCDKGRHSGATDNEAKILEETAHLVLKIALDLDQQSPTDEQSLDSMAVERFDADSLEPAALHNPRDADCVVAIGFVDLHFECGFGVTRVNAKTGNPFALSSVHSHVDVGPLSRPTRTTLVTFFLHEPSDGIRI